MSKFLVIHVDAGGNDDIAEVEAADANEAVDIVQGYPDTLRVNYAIEFEGEPPAVWRTRDFHNALISNGVVVRLGATEGDALEPAAEFVEEPDLEEVEHLDHENQEDHEETEEGLPAEQKQASEQPAEQPAEETHEEAPEA